MLMDWVVWAQRHSVAAVTVVFVLIFIATYWPGRKHALEQHGNIPLDDDA
jgi:cbb3-type cytochrome oxidase subunit 3